MAVYAGSRMDLALLGAIAFDVTCSSGTATLTLSAATTSRYYHGDATDNTDDGTAPANEGTDCLGVALKTALDALALSETFTVTFAPTTGRYTITPSSGNIAITWANAFARRVLGFSGNVSATPAAVSDQACWYWYIFPGAESDDSNRQPADDLPRGYLQRTGRASYGVGPYVLGYMRRRRQRFIQPSLASNITGGAEAWTLWRFFEHHRYGERFLWWDSTVSVFSYANREAVYQFTQEALDAWAVSPIQPNWHGYFEIDLVLSEHTASASA